MATKPDYQIDENGNWVTDAEFRDNLTFALATANSYVDKNIIFNINIDPIDLVQMAEIKKDMVNHAAEVIPYADIRFGSSSAKKVYGDETFTVTADDLTSGNLDITDNGEYNVTNEKTVTVNIPKLKIASVNISIASASTSVTIPSLQGEPLFYSFYNTASNTSNGRVIAAVGSEGNTNILLAARNTFGAAGADFSENKITTTYNKNTGNFTMVIGDTTYTARWGGAMRFTYVYLEENN